MALRKNGSRANSSPVNGAVMTLSLLITFLDPLVSRLALEGTPAGLELLSPQLCRHSDDLDQVYLRKVGPIPFKLIYLVLSAAEIY